MARSDRVRPLLFGAAALVLYALTLAPGVAWGDSAQLQYLTEAPRWSVGPRGYPLWIGLSHLLYRLLPVTPAAAANLLAALCGAVGVALAWRLTRRMTDSRFGADVAAATLAVSHFFWSSSVVAEVYSLSAVIVLLLLLLANRAESGERRPAFAFGFLAALCYLHHRSLLVVAVVLGLLLVGRWVRDGHRARPLKTAVLGFVLGLVPAFVVAVMADTPTDVDLTRIFLGGLETHPPGLAGIPRLLAYEAGFVALNLAGPQLLLLVVGAIQAARSRAPLLAVLGVGLALPFFFSHIGDRYVFLLPAFVAAALLAGAGAARLARRWTRPAFAVTFLVTVAMLPVATYALLAGAVPIERLGVFRAADPRQTASFFWPGRSAERDPRKSGTRIFDALPPNAVVLHGWGEGQVLIYLQRVEGGRPDVVLIPRWRAGRFPDTAAARREGRLFLSAYPFAPPPRRDWPLGPPVLPGLLWPVVQP